MPSKALKYFKKKLTKLRKKARLKGQDCALDLTPLDEGEKEAYCDNRRKALEAYIKDYLKSVYHGAFVKGADYSDINTIYWPPKKVIVTRIPIWIDDPHKPVENPLTGEKANATVEPQ